MKYYSIIAFISAALHSSTGILICRGKCKGFINGICKNIQKQKIIGIYFIATGIIMLGCGFAALYESTASIIYIAVSAAAESVILSLIRREIQ